MPEQSCRLFRQKDHPPPEVGVDSPSASSAPDVEGEEFVLNPPSATKVTREKKRRRNRKRKNQGVRRSERNAGVKSGGARRIKTASDVHLGDRACLSRAIAALVEDPEKKSSFLEAAIKAMPEGRDACPNDLVPALSAHGLALERSSKDYFVPGAPRSYHILREVDCALVLNLRLDGWQSHFVAWDGSIIHDFPHSLKISSADRRTATASEAAFDKLFHDQDKWFVTAVYRLIVAGVSQ